MENARAKPSSSEGLSCSRSTYRSLGNISPFMYTVTPRDAACCARYDTDSRELEESGGGGGRGAKRRVPFLVRLSGLWLLFRSVIDEAQRSCVASRSPAAGACRSADDKPCSIRGNADSPCRLLASADPWPFMPRHGRLCLYCTARARMNSRPHLRACLSRTRRRRMHGIAALRCCASHRRGISPH